MMSGLARCEHLGDRLLVVNANSSKRNALSEDYIQVLRQALETANTDPTIRAVLLRGEGGYFCSGGDLRQLKQRRDMSYADRQGKISQLQDTVRAMSECTKPLVAVVEGGAAGAGVSIALACDFVVASETADFTLAYVKAGLIPDGGISFHLNHLVPRAVAMRMALLAEPVSATRLHELGAVGQLAAEGEVMNEAMTLVDRLAKGPAVAQGAIKTLLNSAATANLDSQLNDERDAMATALGGAEAAEGIQAFLDKRSPEFGCSESATAGDTEPSK